MAIINTTDENFNEKIKGDLVLVDFWASWCSPCKVIAPMLESIAEKLGDKILICKHNIDEQPSVPTRYGVKGIPTLLLFSRSELKDTKVGATSEQNILEFITKHKKED